MKLVAVLAAFLIAGLSSCGVNAQTPITSPNLITNPTFVETTGWTTTGGVGGNGPTHPASPANGNGYTFTYSQGSIEQTYAINQALANVGAGVQIAGFDYGFKYRFGCANSIGGYCENPFGAQDTLNATSTITSNTGATLYTRYYALGANSPAPYSATFSSVDTQQRFSAALPVENLGNFRISFTGMDAGFWGGNYGPTIKDVYSPQSLSNGEPIGRKPAAIGGGNVVVAPKEECPHHGSYFSCVKCISRFTSPLGPIFPPPTKVSEARDCSPSKGSASNPPLSLSATSETSLSSYQQCLPEHLLFSPS